MVVRVRAWILNPATRNDSAIVASKDLNILGMEASTLAGVIRARRELQTHVQGVNSLGLSQEARTLEDKDTLLWRWGDCVGFLQQHFSLIRPVVDIADRLTERHR